MYSLERKWSKEGLKELIRSSVLLTNYKEKLIKESTAVYISDIFVRNLENKIDLIEKSGSLYDYVKKFTKEVFNEEKEAFELDDINQNIINYNYFKSIGDKRLFQLFLYYLNDNNNYKQKIKLERSLIFNYLLSLKLSYKLPYKIETIVFIKDIVKNVENSRISTLLNKSSQYIKKFS